MDNIHANSLNSVVPWKVIKHLLQIKPFKRRCNTAQPQTHKKKYMHLATKSAKHTLQMSHFQSWCPLGKIKFGLYSVFIFHVSLETQWFPPAGDWQKALWKACFTTKVWHFKSHRSPVANSNSVLNISEAFPGSPSVSMEPWAQGPGNKDWQVWFRVLLVAGNSLSSGKASEGGLA